MAARAGGRLLCVCVCNYRLSLSGVGLVSLPTWRGVRALTEQREVACLPAPRKPRTRTHNRPAASGR